MIRKRVLQCGSFAPAASSAAGQSTTVTLRRGTASAARLNAKLRTQLQQYRLNEAARTVRCLEAQFPRSLQQTMKGNVAVGSQSEGGCGVGSTCKCTCSSFPQLGGFASSIRGQEKTFRELLVVYQIKRCDSRKAGECCLDLMRFDPHWSHTDAGAANVAVVFAINGQYQRAIDILGELFPQQGETSSVPRETSSLNEKSLASQRVEGSGGLLSSLWIEQGVYWSAVCRNAMGQRKRAIQLLCTACSHEDEKRRRRGRPSDNHGRTVDDSITTNNSFLPMGSYRTKNLTLLSTLLIADDDRRSSREAVDTAKMAIAAGITDLGGRDVVSHHARCVFGLSIFEALQKEDLITEGSSSFLPADDEITTVVGGENGLVVNSLLLQEGISELKAAVEGLLIHKRNQEEHRGEHHDGSDDQPVQDLLASTGVHVDTLIRQAQRLLVELYSRISSS